MSVVVAVVAMFWVVIAVLSLCPFRACGCREQD
jgi:hypothetical protein